MSRIEMDFHHAKRQAEKLENLALELEQLASGQFHGTIQDLSVNWKGENANAYIQKGQKLENNMRQTARNLRNTSAQIRIIAKRIYDAELYAKQLAEKRTYGDGGGSW